jgi:hypothetical protein
MIQMMGLLGSLITFALFGQSVFALALFIDAVCQCRLNRERLLDFKKYGYKNPGFYLLKRAVDQQALPSGYLDLARNDAAAWIQSLDRGATRINTFLAKTAPMLGLAGTLAGISLSMSQFEQRSAEPEVIIHGFAVAIETTLFGIFVAILCMASNRLLWQPLQQEAATIWDRLERELVLANSPRISSPTGKKKTQPNQNTGKPTAQASRSPAAIEESSEPPATPLAKSPAELRTSWSDKPLPATPTDLTPQEAC